MEVTEVRARAEWSRFCSEKKLDEKKAEFIVDNKSCLAEEGCHIIWRVPSDGALPFKRQSVWRSG